MEFFLSMLAKMSIDVCVAWFRLKKKTKREVAIQTALTSYTAQRNARDGLGLDRKDGQSHPPMVDIRLKWQ